MWRIRAGPAGCRAKSSCSCGRSGSMPCALRLYCGISFLAIHADAGRQGEAGGGEAGTHLSGARAAALTLRCRPWMPRSASEALILGLPLLLAKLHRPRPRWPRAPVVLPVPCRRVGRLPVQQQRASAPHLRSTLHMQPVSSPPVSLLPQLRPCLLRHPCTRPRRPHAQQRLRPRPQRTRRPLPLMSCARASSAQR